MLLIDDESYYLAIGRDAPSIIECLSVGEKVAGWIKDCELQSINEECISVISYSITNEEMLNCVYGHKPDVHQNRIHQTLSDLTHDLGVNTEGDNSQRSNTSESDNEMYISEEKAMELLHTTSISNCSMSTTEETPSIWNDQAQDYHTAAEDAINGISSSQAQDIASDSSPLDGGGSFNLLSQGNYVDHDIAFSSDSSYQSSNSNRTVALSNCHDNMLDQSTYTLSLAPFNNSKVIHDSSLVANQCATPTTEVYHHSSNVTFNANNDNGLQLI